MRKILLSFSSFVMVLLFLGSVNIPAQTQRNPVLEFCTGTWCQWCPCGDQVIEDNILPNLSNAIILAYHGAGSDPFRIFPGSSIISSLGLSAYPTGVIDRTSGVQSRGSWFTLMNSRNSVPATVSIDIQRSYNVATREFNATVDFTALQNLNDQYSYNIILVEDGQVYGQTSNNTCTPGITYIPDYVHYWLVRDMINGALGEEIVNGAWNQGEVISKNVTHTFTIPPAPAPDFVPDSCGIVVLVYKNGSPLNSGAEIQQAEQWPLIAPDYLANISSSSSDEMIESNGSGSFSTVLHNVGLLDDSYYIDVSMDAPTGWSGEFTTPNGTFPFGQQDSVAVPAGDSLVVNVSVSPNALGGFGDITVQFSSQNYPVLVLSTHFRLVTTTGVNGLVIDASGEGYGDVLSGALDQEFPYSYGIVSSEALYPGVDLTNFTLIAWSSGNALPVFTSDEVNALQPFLVNGGRLLINGQDIGEDIFETGGQSQFAQSFYNDYLHANYVSSVGLTFFFKGIDGDPISDQMNFALTDLYPRDPDQFIPNDANASSLFTFSTFTQYNSLKADDGINRVVYFGFGLEEVADQAVRDTLIARSIRWLMNGVVVTAPDENLVAKYFSLDQNYPNPFNPSTTISYNLAENADVSLKVYDVMGQEVAKLVNEKQSAGTHNVQFDASELSSGIYFYKLIAGDFISVKKMSLIK